MAEDESPMVTLTRAYPFSPETVFDAWMDPGKIGKWMFGPPLREERVLRMGLRPIVGGRFSFAVEREGKEFDHVGEYLEIERPSRLAFTWGIKGMSESPDSRVTLSIKPVAAGSELILSHRIPAEWAEFANRTKEGWSKMLDSLERHLKRESGT